MELTEQRAAQISSTWSNAFTQMALGGDTTAFSNLFADKAQLSMGGKTMTLTKGEADPSNAVVTAAMMQAKLVPELEKLNYS